MDKYKKMKKLFVLIALCVLTSVVAMSQKPVEVSEKDVPTNNVVDFQRQALDARDVKWFKVDSITHEVQFIDGDNSLQGIRYTKVGTEHRYYMDTKFCPKSIKNYVKTNYPKFSITTLCVSSARRGTEYKVRIVRKSGFLFWKKEAEVKNLLFSITGEYIAEE